MFSFRYPLKVVVEGVYDVKLYPEEDETLTILNIKRGIISALAVPLVEEDKNKIMVNSFPKKCPLICIMRNIYYHSLTPSYPYFMVFTKKLYIAFYSTLNTNISSNHLYLLLSAHNPRHVQDPFHCQRKRGHCN